MAKNNLIAFEKGEFGDDYNVQHSNPRYWKQDGVRNKFQVVYAPSYPEIESAYQNAGKGVFRNGELLFAEVQENDESEYDVDSLYTPLSSDDFISNDISDVNDVSDISKTSDISAASSEDDHEEPLQEEEVVQESDALGNWRELSWPKMRSMATSFTDEPVKSKEQAIEILEKAEAEGKI